MSFSSFNRVSRLFGIVMALVLVMLPSLASAHEHRTVATDYSFVVGFINEPAIQGDSNGLILEITKGDAPVLNAQDGLQAQVIFGDQTRDLVLEPAFGTDGSYESPFIPTQPGDYTFRIFGTLEGVNIDESFTSSPEGFDSVAPRSDYEFPGVPANGNKDNSDVTTVALPIAAGLVLIVIVGAAWTLRRREHVA
jgi:hypothetical protein